MRRSRLVVVVVISLAGAVLFAGCAPTLAASPTAVTTPTSYTVQVAEARTLAMREVRAESRSDWATMYADRQASACFRDHWPSLGVYKRWWLANWGPLNNGPGEEPSPSAPLKVLSGTGDDQHQIVVVAAFDPTFGTLPMELYVLRQFASGWAILNWLPYSALEVTNGNPPYRVPTQAWNPCAGAQAYTPAESP
jgi:hypothetical protein